MNRKTKPMKDDPIEICVWFYVADLNQSKHDLYISEWTKRVPSPSKIKLTNNLLQQRHLSERVVSNGNEARMPYEMPMDFWLKAAH